MLQNLREVWGSIKETLVESLLIGKEIKDIQFVF